MSTPMVAPRTGGLTERPTLRMITVAALVSNAMTFVPGLLSIGPTFPYDLILGHMIPTLIVAGIVLSRLRWVRSSAACCCSTQACS